MDQFKFILERKKSLLIGIGGNMSITKHSCTVLSLQNLIPSKPSFSPASILSAFICKLRLLLLYK